MNIYEQLIRDEGRIPHAYQDHKGYWTIGVGHLIDKRRGGKLPDHIIFELLQLDVAEKRHSVSIYLPWVDALDEVRAAVIVNMCFMLGIGGLLEFKRTLKAIQEGRYKDAAEHLLDSEMAREQKQLAGDRETRCERLARQLISGQWV